ncbi:MAG: hypothetical protein DWB43_12375 [Lautropia sp.]|nr:MAG: hypothetical protein EDM78_10115 [Pseudomonadota bacterium]MBC6960312.1 hypothetical protein [Lautropia sp.]MDL1906061.1 hypothetical protein [Betaproteobacteria bacterium PRO1]RIK91396.1 MAG: hypothetical protein DCC70_00020 [Burkholderiales bacterium]
MPPPTRRPGPAAPRRVATRATAAAIAPARADPAARPAAARGCVGRKRAAARGRREPTATATPGTARR